VILSLLERYQEETSETVAVYERSLEAGREVFLQSQADLIDNRDYLFLRDLYFVGEEIYESSQCIFSIYLTCSEQEMLARHKKRGRLSERNLRRVTLFSCF
jgi:deoxyadenosine/deoxycytidine kinase